ncbi:uncharacterized protein LOC114544644 [Dendronephthya gigantea]|uniref:uncharacterized protein LOC114543567 n=1 Tax=Dendronephthya gigantea TaxID=151771 RepID=UPI00106C6C9A|nr:uncharacterized protein LOC114543567 [Dendronephthya gigantea]XP_028419025.1 uncharacterized protein LOC114544644 [Dendronephthya gigantea]
MGESEMGWLARHLGHDIHVHKDYYRLPDTTLELAVVGNLLMAVDEGRAHHFKGRILVKFGCQNLKKTQNKRLLRMMQVVYHRMRQLQQPERKPCAPSSTRKRTERKPWTTKKKMRCLRCFQSTYGINISQERRVCCILGE